MLCARTRCGGHVRIEEAGLAEMAPPQLDGPAVGQRPRPAGCCASLSSGIWPISASTWETAAAAWARSPVLREAAKRIVAAASRAAAC